MAATQTRREFAQQCAFSSFQLRCNLGMCLRLESLREQLCLKHRHR